MTELLLWVFQEAQIIRIQAQIDIPIPPVLQPVFMPFLIGAGLHEEFHFHLLEFPSAENEVSWGDLVAKTLAGLANAKGGLFACRIHHIEIVHKDALRCFGTQIMQRGIFFDRANHGAQHAVEITRLGEFTFGTAIRTGDISKPMWGLMLVLLSKCLE